MPFRFRNPQDEAKIEIESGRSRTSIRRFREGTLKDPLTITAIQKAIAKLVAAGEIQPPVVIATPANLAQDAWVEAHREKPSQVEVEAEDEPAPAPKAKRAPLANVLPVAREADPPFVPSHQAVALAPRNDEAEAKWIEDHKEQPHQLDDEGGAE